MEVISKTYKYRPVTTKHYKYGKINDDLTAIKEGNIPGDSEITEVSPIGQKIIGKEVGYIFSVSVRNRVNYKIINILN